MAKRTFQLRVARHDDSTERMLRVEAESSSHAEQLAGSQGWLVTGKAEELQADWVNRLRWELVVGVLLLGLPIAYHTSRFIFDAARSERELREAIEDSRRQLERFDGMNAMGATANSIENIEAQVHALSRSVDQLTNSTIPLYFVAAVGVALILRGIPRTQD